VRCGAVLYRAPRSGLDGTLAYVLAAIPLFVIANFFPLVEMEVSGQHLTASLLGAVNELIAQNDDLIASLVFVTIWLAPAVQLLLMSWLLIPIQSGRRPPGAARILRVVQAMRPWNMIEVFIIGALVALGKLSHTAHMIPGVALWSLSVLMMLLAAANGAFEPRDVWQRLDMQQ
jgi:paraquat-inducible protein A